MNLGIKKERQSENNTTGTDDLISIVTVFPDKLIPKHTIANCIQGPTYEPLTC
jgi:hypothetical protein